MCNEDHSSQSGGETSPRHSLVLSSENIKISESEKECTYEQHLSVKNNMDNYQFSISKDILKLEESCQKRAMKMSLPRDTQYLETDIDVDNSFKNRNKTVGYSSSLNQSTKKPWHVNDCPNLFRKKKSSDISKSFTLGTSSNNVRETNTPHVTAKPTIYSSKQLTLTNTNIFKVESHHSRNNSPILPPKINNYNHYAVKNICDNASTMQIINERSPLESTINEHIEETVKETKIEVLTSPSENKVSHVRQKSQEELVYDVVAKRLAEKLSPTDQRFSNLIAPSLQLKCTSDFMTGLFETSVDISRKSVLMPDLKVCSGRTKLDFRDTE